MTDVLAGYVARIRADCPTLAIAAARLNSDGMMNDVVVINDDQVFRFAKNEYAQTLLAYEAQLLEIIGRYVTISVPRIVHRADGYVHYRLVPGVPLYRHSLLRVDPAIQESLAHQLATFLRQLHAIPSSDAPLPPWQATAPPASRRTVYEQRLAALEQDVYPLLWADQKAWIRDLYAPILDGRVDLDAFTSLLIHRDLASYHILYVPQAGQLTGVIDFGTAGAGDPAIDWACLINTYGEQFVRRMHQAYPIAQATMDRARFLAGALELEWALAGIQDKDPSMLLVHLGRARDSLPLLAPWP
jgi:aminoglycoside 2''-phosphotransferase